MHFVVHLGSRHLSCMKILSTIMEMMVLAAASGLWLESTDRKLALCSLQEMLERGCWSGALPDFEGLLRYWQNGC